MPSLLILILLCALLWFVLLRPQRRRVRQYQATVSAVAVGDRIMTTGGIYGDVVAIEGDQMTLAVAPGVELEMAKAAVGKRLDIAGAAPSWSDETPEDAGDAEDAAGEAEIAPPPDEVAPGDATPGEQP
jgi:preprotein translocase subunit YajC